MLSLLTNPIIIAVILLCILCLCRINVLLALIISSVVGGLVGHIGLSDVMDIFIHGMGDNSETALSYILLGAFAASMTHTGLAPILAMKISKVIKSKKYMLIFILTGIAILSQNLIPVHIAFIPILVPPLLALMNELKIDRRAVACGLAFGLEAPYIAIPAGFGLIFQGLIAENMMQNGVEVVKSDIWKYNWIIGACLFVGFLVAIFISYRKPRNYENLKIKDEIKVEDLKLNKNHYITLIAAVITLGVQLWTNSLPLGALVGLAVIFGFKAIDHDKMEYKFENIKIIDFIKTLTVYKGTSLRKLIAKLALQKGISDCYSNFYAKLKKETIKFSEVADIADALGYEIIFKEK